RDIGQLGYDGASRSPPKARRGGNVASGLRRVLGLFCWSKRGGVMTKIEAVVVRDRVETVMEAVEELTGHVGITVIEAVRHGGEKGIPHEYRGRIFESRFLPKAYLIFVVRDEIAEGVMHAIVDAARTGHVNGDGVCWSTPVFGVTHNRTGLALEEMELA